MAGDRGLLYMERARGLDKYIGDVMVDSECAPGDFGITIFLW